MHAQASPARADALPDALHIGSVRIAPNMILAPMSGVTDRPFRQTVKRCSEGHVGLVVTEFIAVERFTSAALIADKQLQFDPWERPIAVQIFGADVDAMCFAAEAVQRTGADILDVNAGCPAPKVVRRGGGAGMLRTLDRLHAVLRALTATVDIPVTLKTRPGWDDDHRVALDVLSLAEDAGVAMLAIHGRSRTQLYRGQADWDIVAELVGRARIPIVGSGDVACWEDAQRRLRETGCAGVMIGRAALRDPFVFAHIHRARCGLPAHEVTIGDRVAALEDYVERVRGYHTGRWVKARAKRMASSLIHGVPGVARFRQRIQHLPSADAIVRAAQELRDASG